MISLQAKNLTKYYGAEEIFSNLSFTVEAGEKIGLVGPNGAGKTTLLKCLTGQEFSDGGEIVKAEGIRIGYLEQIPFWQEKRTIMEEMLEVFSDLLAMNKKISFLEKEMGNNDTDKIMERYSALVEEYEQAGGYLYENKIKRVVKGLGFQEEDFTRDIRLFSGGQKTRLNLAKILVREPEMLILDEPNNHLDIAAIEWLENYLRDYNGTLLIISHDRFFLDKTVTKILELNNNRLSIFKGNYSVYLKLKEEQTMAQTNAYFKQSQEIKRTEEYIKKYRAGIKAKQARGRQSILNRLERLACPEQEKKLVKISFQPARLSGEKVLSVSELKHCFAEKTVLHEVNFSLTRGEKVGLVGANGTGKSTILKIIAGHLKPKEGQAILGSQVQIGYFAQEYETLQGNNAVLQEITAEFSLSQEKARTLLGSFLFIGDDVFKQVNNLSGGEKARLALLKILLRQPNLLILDEPTNHLDIPAKEAVERALQDYRGTILVVSHDRYFLDQVINKILELENGEINYYWGNYSDYKEKKEEIIRQKILLEQSKKGKKTSLIKEKEKKKQEKERTLLEEEIANLEEEIANFQEKLTLPEIYSDGMETKKILAEIKEKEKKLETKYLCWEKILE